MPERGTRTPLFVTYSWGKSGLEAQFAGVFEPAEGIFSPGYPLAPLEPENTRLWDFPVGVNRVYTPRSYEPISFAELRALADAHDITRLAIETRKDQLEKLDWTIKPRGLRHASADTHARCDRLLRFWHRPDGERPFATWLRDLLEDPLVIDAPALEIRHSRAGDIIGLDVVDGATIKLLVDDTGRRPRPPAPAYQQVIHGRPWKLLTGDELIYWPRNPRPHKAYGFSPVEQIVMTVNIALRRQTMQLQHFTEGNVPPPPRPSISIPSVSPRRPSSRARLQVEYLVARTRVCDTRSGASVPRPRLFIRQANCSCPRAFKGAILISTVTGIRC